MKTIIHLQIIEQALGRYFSPAALEELGLANIGQDALKYQVGHDHYHYDADAFEAGDAYCRSLRQETAASMAKGDMVGARVAFGKLTHTVQDLYAHSNYVELFHQMNPYAKADEIEPLLPEILNHPGLISGKIYYPWEAVTFLPGLPSWVAGLFPADSHARMNKDNPAKHLFEYALVAAIKRTSIEFDNITRDIPESVKLAFTGH